MTAQAPCPFDTWFPHIGYHHVLAECADELARRQRFFPRRVQSGDMTAEEMDYQIAIAAAWRADVQRIIAFEEAAAQTWKDFLENPAVPRITEMSGPGHGYTWKQRRDAITRELGFRARVYTRRIESGAMTQQEADHRTACLQALAARYDKGFDWRASNGERTHFGHIRTSPAIEQARREWNEHWQAVEARRTPAKQKEMAL